MQDIIIPKQSLKPQLSDNHRAPVEPIVEAVESPLTAEDDEFVTPQQAAEQDISGAESVTSFNIEAHGSKKPRRFFRPPTGKREWLLLLAFILISAGVGYGLYRLTRPDPVTVTNTPDQTVIKDEKKLEPTPIVSRLTGLTISDESINTEPVTAVMIENSAEARPQSGLLEAGIVFEAIAEGGITRFTALYQDTAPEYVGPVRSVRPYYLDWIMPFNASLAHVGGSPEALNDIKTLGVTDLDEFYNSNSYTRITDRYAPHNAYTSLSKLNTLEKSKGHTTIDFTSFTRKADSPATTPTASTVSVAVSGAFYNSSYIYDKITNSYLRSQAGTKHIDLKTQKQLTPKVVITVVMSRGYAADGEHTSYQTTGNGQMIVFQDGIATKGTWKKTSRQAQWQFFDDTGKPLTLNAGQTWVTMIDSIGSVSYAP